MRRRYDIEALALQYGFNRKDIEKVCRISDLLEDISAIKFLSDRLSLYGGTAFTFIYSPEISRLSIDLDFNYRHKDAAHWKDVRFKIDDKLKDLLYRQGYSERDIAINEKGPLKRFHVSYVNDAGSKDKFKVEIAYQNRMPIMKSDTMADFKHIGTQETFKTTTPLKEELFANKWCTLLYRGTPRDLFDTHQIIKMNFNNETFRKCAIIDSLAHKKPKIYKTNLTKIDQISIDSSLKNLLQTEKYLNYELLKNQKRCQGIHRNEPLTFNK